MRSVDGHALQIDELKGTKPTEKIEGIRINNISGFAKSGGSDSSSTSESSSVNNVIDGVLDLALQLPAVKKIGEEVGLNVSEGLKGLSDSLDSTVSLKETKERGSKENKDKLTIKKGEKK